LKTKKTLAVSLNTFLSLYAIYKAKMEDFGQFFGQNIFLAENFWIFVFKKLRNFRILEL